MAMVTVTELKAVLGVGNLYPDADLQQVCTAADAVVRSYLANNTAQAAAYARSNNVGYVYSATPHGYVVGQSVTIADVATGLNGAQSITDTGTYYVAFANAGADIEQTPLRPYGSIVGPTSFNPDTVPACKEAALTLAVDMWQNRTAPGGQPTAVDFTPSPYRMGRTMVQRVMGLLAPYLDMRGQIG